jgi:hypothetical protein
MEDGMKKYRPSNGTEGECFMAKFCAHCKNDDEENDVFCDIIASTMAFAVDEPGYPEEWQYDCDGKPTCTAFANRAR